MKDIKGSQMVNQLNAMSVFAILNPTEWVAIWEDSEDNVERMPIKGARNSLTKYFGDEENGQKK